MKTKSEKDSSKQDMQSNNSKKALAKYQRKQIDQESMDFIDIIEDRGGGYRLSKEEVLRKEKLKNQRLNKK